MEMRNQRKSWKSSEKTPGYSARKFGGLLQWHMDHGTRPNGKAQRWTCKTFAHAANSTERTVRNWLNNKNVPVQIELIERALFGDSAIDQRQELRDAYDAAKVSKRGLASRSYWRSAPYPGLRTFRREEAEIFYGRDEEARELAARIEDEALGFIAVIGASGTGKSSLVYAGALPRLNAGWRVLTLSPRKTGNNPVAALAYELSQQLSQHSMYTAPTIAERLVERPERLSSYASMLLEGCSEDAAFVLFIDQFEELFGGVAEQRKREFIQLIEEAFDERQFRTVISLRSDFLPEFLNEPSLAKLVQPAGAILALGIPDAGALEEMIRGPAGAAGLDLEDGLVVELLKDAGPNPGNALPLVAFCLEELYRRVQLGLPLSLAAYNELGRLRGAIGRRAQEILQPFEADGQADVDQALAQIFHQIIRIDAMGKEVRQPAARSALLTTAAPGPKLVEALINGGLLIAEDTHEHPVVTLRHEALLQEWGSLRSWLDENRPLLQRVQRQLLNLAAREPEDRLHAVKSFGRMGAEAAPDLYVPALINALSDVEKDIREAAASVLSNIGLANPAVIPVLIKALSHADKNVRKVAVHALCDLGHKDPAVIPALEKALSNADPIVRWTAIDALGRIGTFDPTVMPALTKALRHADENVRHAAVYSLRDIGPKNPAVIPALTKALSDTDPIVRETAIDALGRIGSEAHAVIPALMKALRDGDVHVRPAAVDILGLIGPKHPAVIPALEKALSDRDEHVRRAAVGAMARIDPKDPAVIPALIKALGDDDKHIRRATVYFLRRIGPKDPAVIPALIKALNDSDHIVRRRAIDALARIDLKNPAVVPALIQALNDSDHLVRREAVEALGRIGSDALAVVPALIKALNDDDHDVRREAVDALARIDPKAPSVIPALIRALGDDNEHVRRATVYFLRRIGPNDPAVIPALIKALNDSDKEVRRAVVYGLSRIDPKGPAVISALIKALDDDDEHVHRIASTSLAGSKL